MDRPTIISTFKGALDMSNPMGALYGPHTQVANITFSLSNPVPGGTASIAITADGTHTITIPDEWVKYGGDDISEAAASVNHLMVFYQDADLIYYSNKVVS